MYFAIADTGHNDSIARTRGVCPALEQVLMQTVSSSTPAGTNVDGKAKLLKMQLLM